MRTAVTEKKVTGALKKIIPDTATGNLFNAPAILVHQHIPGNCATNLYVVEEVTRRHHAVQ